MCHMNLSRVLKIARTLVTDYGAEAAVERFEGTLECDGKSVFSEVAGTRT